MEYEVKLEWLHILYKVAAKQARQISAAKEYEILKVVSQQSLLGNTTSPEKIGFTHFSIGISEY